MKKTLKQNSRMVFESLFKFELAFAQWAELNFLEQQLGTLHCLFFALYFEKQSSGGVL